MKIKYLLLHKRLNLPGIGLGNSNKLNANGLDSTHNGCVKAIWETPNGYRVFIPSGMYKGFYTIPFTAVDHAGVEYTAAEQKAMCEQIDEHDAAIEAEKKEAEAKKTDGEQKTAEPKTQRTRKPAAA